MGVSKNANTGAPTWMVKIMENPIKNGLFWGYHYFWKHPYRKMTPFRVEFYLCIFLENISASFDS